MLKLLLCGLLIIALCSFSVIPSFAQELTTDDKNEIIDSVLSAYRQHYLYPEVSAEFCDHIRDKHKNGDYDKIKDLGRLTSTITGDIRAVVDDGHIWVLPMSRDDISPGIGDTITQDKIEIRAADNFGFRKVEHLTGNIGYLRFDRFDDPSYAGQSAAAALNFLAECDAIIIDLRNNHGGEENMVSMISGYFFKTPVLLNSLYFTETDSLIQSRSHAYVPGKRPVDAELYILTSPHTASGAEAFAYAMKHHERATLIGETTVGAAHWSEYYDFPDLGIRAHIPIARPINPVTKTSWEGTGVEPNIRIQANRALASAHLMAIDKLGEKATDESRRKSIQWDKIKVAAMYNPITLTDDQKKEYTGQYADGKYAFLIKDGELYWRYTDGSEYMLIPLDTDLFGFDDTEDIRVKCYRDENGRVNGFNLVDRRDGGGPIRLRTGDL